MSVKCVRPFRHMVLCRMIESEKQFLKQFNKTKENAQQRKLIKNASPRQIRLLSSLIYGLYDTPDIRISDRAYKKIESVKKVKFFESNLSRKHSLRTISELRRLLLKVQKCLKVFTVNVLS